MIMQCVECDHLTTLLEANARIVGTQIGVFLILQGLMAELLMRTYYESQGKRVYLVRAVRDARPKEG